MLKFNVGDRVICVSDPHMNESVGKTGVITFVEDLEGAFTTEYVVSWDDFEHERLAASLMFEDELEIYNG